MRDTQAPGDRREPFIRRRCVLVCSRSESFNGSFPSSRLGTVQCEVLVLFQRFRERVKRAQRPAGEERHRRSIVALRDGDLALATDDLRRHIEWHQSQV